MRFCKDMVFVAVIATVSALLSGCVLVPIAGFGYSGYQYHEKEGVFAPGQPLGGPAPDSDKDKKPAASTSKPPPPTDSNVE